MSEELKRPESSMNLYVNITGLLSFYLSLVLINYFHPDMDRVVATIVCIFSSFTIPLYFDLFVYKKYKKASSGFHNIENKNPDRILVKLLGFLATFFIAWLIYNFLPEYQIDYHQHFKSIANYSLLILAVLGLYYLIEADIWMKEPEDGYYHMGKLTMVLLFAAKKEEINWIILKEHFRNWFIKIFFFPIMFGVSYIHVDFLLKWNISDFTDKRDIYFYFQYLIFSMDVVFACAGYLITFRVVDSHIKSVDPTKLGWIFCLMCYVPFSGYSTSFFKYNNGFFFYDWLYNDDILFIIWAGIVLFANAIYAFSTVAFGYRFSNLTYRGIITSGPYRFSKHPAYITKNIAWWFYSVPFISADGWKDAAAYCFGLSLINLIYFMRARTEENHLSNYPEYVQYANWMNEHGTLRFIGKLIPFFAYSEERAKRQGALTWQKQLEKKERELEF